MVLLPRPCRLIVPHEIRRRAGSITFCCAYLATPPVFGAEGDWHYGAYLDLSYAANLGGDRKIDWRSKLTTRNLNAFDPNMGLVYLDKSPSENSRWGFELGFQAGNDMDAQKPAKDQNPIPGADVLTYIARANVSYLADVGKGLRLRAGLMNSFIDFESMYAGNNPNYTRAWMADYSPYFLIGAGGDYQVRDDVSVSFYVLTDYDYLAFSGKQPKYGSQFKWNLTSHWTLTQNVFLGPEQDNTAMRYWRGFSDTLLNWRADDLMVNLAYDVGTEKRAVGGLQSLWMGSAIWTRWHIAGPWSVALRPEVYWDPDGEMTGSKQLIAAITTTAEYKLPLGPSNALLRLEFRHDSSTGPQGGFFNPARNDPQLVPGQNLFFMALIWTIDDTR